MHKVPHEFDSYAKEYRKNLDKNLWLSGESSTFFAEYKVNKLKEWLPEFVDKESTMLDFGCGDGLMTSFIKAVFPRAHVYGIDPSSESIEVATLAYENIHFSLSDTTIDFENATFDLVVSAGTFHHIPFDQHRAYVQEIHRVLKPGGTFVMFELNPFNPLTRWTFKHNPIDKNACMMRPRYTEKILKSYGSVATYFYCFFPHFLRSLRFVEPYLIKVPVGALYASIMKKTPSLL